MVPSAPATLRISSSSVPGFLIRDLVEFLLLGAVALALGALLHPVPLTGEADHP